jgi:hypothetical protein
MRNNNMGETARELMQGSLDLQSCFYGEGIGGVNRIIARSVGYALRVQIATVRHGNNNRQGTHLVFYVIVVTKYNFLRPAWPSPKENHEKKSKQFSRFLHRVQFFVRTFLHGK